MAFDKSKTLRAAEKYLELGKIPAAIKEYCKIVESDPDDFTTLNMLGDLHVRVGNKEQAILSFTRIADHYREQEFDLKAIAMYKKVDRLRPHDTEIAHTLATLYAQQDLVVEARAHYLLVADAYTRANETQKALGVLRKTVDLDPQNTNIRIKLAEAYLKTGMKKEAVASFADAGERSLASGAFDRALAAYAKSLEIDPVYHASLKGLLATHSARGTPDEAAEIIERVVANNPDDAELLLMLANAYLEAEEPAEAERVTDALVAKDSFSYLTFVDVARLYLKTDKLEDAVRVIEDVADRMLAGREDSQLLDLVNEVLVVDSDNVRALRLLVRVYWSRREGDELRATLERLAEAAEAAGLASDERYALTQLTRLSDETPYLERLNELGGPDEEAAAEALPVFDNDDHNVGASEPIVSNAEFAEIHETQFTPDATEIPNFESNEARGTAKDWAPAATDAGSEFEIGFDPAMAKSPAREATETVDSAALLSAEPQAAARARELESVDFYIAQGYFDIAIDTLDLLEKQFGPHPDTSSRREQITSMQWASAAADGEDSTATVVEETHFPEFDFPAPVEELPALVPEATDSADIFAAEPAPPVSAPAAAIDPGLAELFEEFRLSEEAEAGTNGDYETHYNLGLAYKEMDLMEEAVEEFQTAIGLTRPSDGSTRYLQCCNLLGHCFLQQGEPRLAVTWFNKGLTAPGHSEDEYQALRFDLGTAYEQVGEIDRALEIFTEIYGTDISYRGVKEKLHELQRLVASSQNGNHEAAKTSSRHGNSRHKPQVQQKAPKAAPNSPNN